MIAEAACSLDAVGLVDLDVGKAVGGEGLFELVAGEGACDAAGPLGHVGAGGLVHLYPRGGCPVAVTARRRIKLSPRAGLNLLIATLDAVAAQTYIPLTGEHHRHGAFEHSHPHDGPHAHAPERHDHGHSHGLVHRSIKRSREGIRAVLIALGVLSLTAVAQTIVFAMSGSVALLADLIHNFGDALTAVPLGIAFLLRSEHAERTAGKLVVAAIFISAAVAGVESILRLLNADEPDHLLPLALAGAVGYAGNLLAAAVRTRAGRRLDSPALIADGDHARADAYVSLGVIASAAVVAIGVPVADPLIGLAITLLILRITWRSWQTVSAGRHHRGAEHE